MPATTYHWLRTGATTWVTEEQTNDTPEFVIWKRDSGFRVKARTSPRWSHDFPTLVDAQAWVYTQ